MRACVWTGEVMSKQGTPCIHACSVWCQNLTLARLLRGAALVHDHLQGDQWLRVLDMGM
jgi:hypothetical protein